MKIIKTMSAEKEKILISLKKARSLINKIVEMVEQNKYCVDIMQQNSAARGLLRSAEQMLMKKHLNSCFKSAMATGSEKKKQDMINEILQVTKMKKV